ncbi:MAG: hypothetical protein LAQ69_33025 [Acidobacteriia bacterium]|nr:hypothetical protein [Terriglobia bacterium]
MIARSLRAIASGFLMPLTLSVLHADVTLRYKTEVKINPALPAQMAADAMKRMDSAILQESVLRFKGGKGFSSRMGYDSITDFTTKEITLLDTAAKRYAKLTSFQFAEELVRAMPEMPAGPGATAPSMVAVTPAKLTGRTAAIQGVEAEERELVFSMQGLAMPNMPTGPMMKMVLQFWTAKPGELMRVPAIRELNGYSFWSYATMNPAASIGKMMKQLPGFSDTFEAMMKEMQTGALLRVHVDMFMPAMAAMLQRMPAGSNESGANLDPDAPFVQINHEVSELSTTTVPDSLFQIPEGYQEAAASELIKGLIAKSQAAVKQ